MALFLMSGALFRMSEGRALFEKVPLYVWRGVPFQQERVLEAGMTRVSGREKMHRDSFHREPFAAEGCGHALLEG